MVVALLMVMILRWAAVQWLVSITLLYKCIFELKCRTLHWFLLALTLLIWAFRKETPAPWTMMSQGGNWGGIHQNYLRVPISSSTSTEGRDRGNNDTAPRKAKVLMQLLEHGGCWVGQGRTSNRFLGWESGEQGCLSHSFCMWLWKALLSLDLSFSICKMVPFEDDL